MSDTFIIHTDGGSRGNPGPAAFAYTIERLGEAIIEENGYLGDTTNNIAEYTALLKALQHAHELGARSVVLNSDSELMVQQMNGKYKVKNPGILPIYREARRIADAIGDVKIRHIYREHNSRADRLCNDALDDRRNLPVVPSLTRSSVVTPTTPVPVVNAKSSDLKSEAIKVLTEARAAWSDDDDPNPPTPEEIWCRLEALIRKSGE